MTDRKLLDDIINKYYWYKVNTIKNEEGKVIDETFILVKAIETKAVFGRIDVLIKPVIGKGQFWTRYDKLSLEEIPFGIIAESVAQIKLL